ncbi:hypothetical protein BGZ50_005473, partial [Haplosporangium sp. Z 11]
PLGHNNTLGHPTESLGHNNTLGRPNEPLGHNNTLDQTKGRPTEPLGHNNALDQTKGHQTGPLNTLGYNTQPLTHNNASDRSKDLPPKPLGHDTAFDHSKTGPLNTLGYNTQPLTHNNALDRSKDLPPKPLDHNNALDHTKGRPTEPLGHNNTLNHTKEHHIASSNNDRPTATDHNTHGKKINTSAFLSAVRFSDEGAGANAGNVAQPDVVHNPSRSHVTGHTDATHASHGGLTNTTAGVGHGVNVPTNTHNNVNPAVANPYVIGQKQPDDAGPPYVIGQEHHQHHKVDDPQHGITSRLVGEPRDPNNLEPAHLKPTM